MESIKLYELDKKDLINNNILNNISKINGIEINNELFNSLKNLTLKQINKLDNLNIIKYDKYIKKFINSNNYILVKYLINIYNYKNCLFFLKFAVINNNFKISKLLIKKEYSLHDPDLDFSLKCSIKYNYLKLLKYLIKIKRKKLNQDILLYTLRINANKEILEVILDNMEKNIINYTYTLRLIYSDINKIKIFINKGINFHYIILAKFCKNNNIEDIKYLFEKYNNINKIYILLHTFNLDIIKYLIKQNLDITDYIEFLIKKSTRCNKKEIFDYLIPFAYHKNLRTGHKYFDNIKFNNKDNINSLNKYNKYIELKKELIYKVNIKNYREI